VRQNTKNQLTRPRFYWVEEIGFGGCDKSGREWGVGVALNVNEVIDYFSGKKTSKYVNGFFEYYQPRYTYGGYERDLNN